MLDFSRYNMTSPVPLTSSFRICLREPGTESERFQLPSQACRAPQGHVAAAISGPGKAWKPKVSEARIACQESHSRLARAAELVARDRFVVRFRCCVCLWVSLSMRVRVRVMVVCKSV